MIVLTSAVAALLARSLGLPSGPVPAPRGLQALMACGLVRNMVRSALRA